MKRSVKTLVELVVVISIAAAALYRFKFSPVPAKTRTVGREDLVKTVFGTGTLEAKTRVAISPQNTGLLVKLYADQGDTVKAGQLLAVMSSEDITQQLKVAEAEMGVTRAGLDRIDSEIASVKASLEYARAAFNRSERLLKNQADSQSNFDKNREAFLVATAALEQANKKKLEMALSLTRHQAQINYYQSKLAETRLLAPFDGLVVRRNREQGSIVNPGVSIMDMIDTSEIWASVWVDEAAISILNPGQKAQVVFRSLPAMRFPGKVRRTSRETDRETREYRVDIAIDRLPQNWAVGQRLEVYIEAGQKKNCVAVPTSLIRWRENTPVIFAEEGGKIAERELKIGIQTKDKTEVISGLSENDRVILNPQKHLSHAGRRIRR